MKSFVQLSVAILLFFTAPCFSKGINKIDNSKRAVHVSYILLNGQAVSKGNSLDADGNIHKFKDQSLQELMHTRTVTTENLLF